MAERCPEPLEGCKYAGTPECLITKHHNYWPSALFSTLVERHFVNLPENISMERRCEHDEIHATQEPPEKPDVMTMVYAIEQSERHVPRKLGKEILRITQRRQEFLNNYWQDIGQRR